MNHILNRVCSIVVAALIAYPAFSVPDTTIKKRNGLAEWSVILPKKVQRGVMTELTVQLKNANSKEWTGYLVFELLDSEKSNIDGLLYNVFPNQYFTLEYNKQAEVKFPFTIPLNFNGPLYYTIQMFDTKLIDSIKNTIAIKK